MTRETALPLSAEEEQTTRMVIAARRAHPVDGDAFTLRLLATLDAARTPGEPGLRCEKCAGTDISVRWDSNFYDCLHVQQERSDWPRDGGEHLHRQCRTCGWTWAAALSQTAEAEHDDWCDGSGSSAGSACCRLAAQPRQEAPSE